jgi:dihydroflavonol-4-reductase
MRVLVTGGTGFVGGHAVAAIRERGHDVRLLVRDPSRVRPALSPLGVDESAVEAMYGDVLDEAAVNRAMTGCDAVVHAAAVFTYDARRVDAMRATNTRATELVLGAANRLHLDPIVHVSSYVALLPPSTPVLGPDEALKTPEAAYPATKAASERVARDLQAAGAPVTIIQPGLVWGPDDPHLGESAQLAVSLLRGLVPLRPSGGFPMVDVRDLARALSAAIEVGRGPRRYLVGGRFITLGALAARLSELTGRPIRGLDVPAGVLLPGLRVVDRLQRRLPMRLPAHFGGTWVLSVGVPTDDSRADKELGFRLRPLNDSLADTIRSLVRGNRLPTRLAGRLITTAPPG